MALSIETRLRAVIRALVATIAPAIPETEIGAREQMNYVLFHLELICSQLDWEAFNELGELREDLGLLRAIGQDDARAGEFADCTLPDRSELRARSAVVADALSAHLGRLLAGPDPEILALIDAHAERQANRMRAWSEASSGTLDRAVLLGEEPSDALSASGMVRDPRG